MRVLCCVVSYCIVSISYCIVMRIQVNTLTISKKKGDHVRILKKMPLRVCFLYATHSREAVILLPLHAAGSANSSRVNTLLLLAIALYTEYSSFWRVATRRENFPRLIINSTSLKRTARAHLSNLTAVCVQTSINKASSPSQCSPSREW